MNITNDFQVKTICVVGLGYVGLPLAVEFGKKMSTIGFDIDKYRIRELCEFHDRTNELTPNDLREAVNIVFTDDEEKLDQANTFIITVPTPIDDKNNPDLTPLKSASEIIGKHIKRGDIVIYESTVFPGATEEICVPILEQNSGMRCNQDFYVGYSPERINPGDKVNTIRTIKKITSGSTPDAAEAIDQLYKKIIDAGTHKAPNIKTAEAAKVIENTQRDLNIAIINEFSKIFNLMNIDTEEVLDAAATKWNFLKFKPGLVGGHCISVDPYYLTHKALDLGYEPEIILAGRRMNETMSLYCAAEMAKAMAQKEISLHNSRVLVLGITFKGNCPDVRNTKVVDLIAELKRFNISVDVYDSSANDTEVWQLYGIELIKTLAPNRYDGIIIAVDHSEIKDLGIEYIRSLGKSRHVLFDVKHVFKKHEVDLRL